MGSTVSDSLGRSLEMRTTGIKLISFVRYLPVHTAHHSPDLTRTVSELKRYFDIVRFQWIAKQTHHVPFRNNAPPLQSRPLESKHNLPENKLN